MYKAQQSSNNVCKDYADTLGVKTGNCQNV
jgi:hypothetical protein